MWQRLPISWRKPIEKAIIGMVAGAVAGAVTYLTANEDSPTVKGLLIALIVGALLAVKNALTPRPDPTNPPN